MSHLTLFLELSMSKDCCFSACWAHNCHSVDKIQYYQTVWRSSCQTMASDCCFWPSKSHLGFWRQIRLCVMVIKVEILGCCLNFFNFAVGTTPPQKKTQKKQNPQPKISTLITIAQSLIASRIMGSSNSFQNLISIYPVFFFIIII